MALIKNVVAPSPELSIGWSERDTYVAFNLGLLLPWTKDFARLTETVKPEYSPNRNGIIRLVYVPIQQWVSSDWSEQS